MQHSVFHAAEVVVLVGGTWQWGLQRMSVDEAVAGRTRRRVATRPTTVGRAVEAGELVKAGATDASMATSA